MISEQPDRGCAAKSTTTNLLNTKNGVNICKSPISQIIVTTIAL